MYDGTKNGKITVQKKGSGLLLLVKGNTFALYPETANRFYTKESDLTFEFIQNKEHEVLKMLVRERGSLVEEALYSSKK